MSDVREKKAVAQQASSTLHKSAPRLTAERNADKENGCRIDGVVILRSCRRVVSTNQSHEFAFMPQVLMKTECQWITIIYLYAVFHTLNLNPYFSDTDLIVTRRSTVSWHSLEPSNSPLRESTSFFITRQSFTHHSSRTLPHTDSYVKNFWTTRRPVFKEVWFNCFLME